MTTQYTQNFGLAKPDFRSGPWHDLINGDIDKLDQLIFGAVSNSNVNAWENNTAYAVGISVLDGIDATTWMCAQAHTSPALPTTFSADRAAHPGRWVQLLAGFAPRGQWTNNTNYFPYDIAYDTARGIMALCTVKHTSNVSGNIRDDAAFWSYLVDMGTASLATAVAVTYTNSSSGIPATNVQAAIDYEETQIVALNNVNVTQGNNITALQSSDSTQNTTLTNHGTRLTSIEGVNTSQDTTLGTHTTQIAAMQAQINSIAPFAAGTAMVFFQAAAPTGWTKQTTHTDKLLRVTTGSGGVAGGSTPFSTYNAQTVVGNTTLSAAQIPQHLHDITPDACGQNFSAAVSGGLVLGGAGAATTDYTGGSGAHNHPISRNIQYVDVIICTKN